MVVGYPQNLKDCAQDINSNRINLNIRPAAKSLPLG